MNTPTEQQARYPVTFLVDDVVVAESPILTEPLSIHVTKRFNRKFHLLEQPEKPVTNASLDSLVTGKASSEAQERLAHAPERPGVPPLPKFPRRKLTGEELERYIPQTVNRSHALVDAIATAFRWHRPLTLTPDAIWLTIEQGFTHHVEQNAETFRHRLVRHHGKEKLTAKVPDFTLTSFDLAISSFSAQIRDRTDPVLHETLLCDFSTTTATIRTASEVVLMDCYSPFFTYSAMCVCGIPKVSVTGTVEDWQRIRSRIDVLETFELSWWTSRLRLILNEFIRTVEGDPDLTFWQAIYKPKQGYAATNVGGWIIDLFPYLNDVPTKTQSGAFKHPRENWCLQGGGGIPDKYFPAGLSSVPIEVTLPTGPLDEKIELVGGFFGLEQSPQDLSLSPIIGWAVAEPPSSKPTTL